MNLLLNLLWIVLGGGFFIALQYLLGGLVLCLTVVGIPFGMQCFKLAHLSLFPFGKTIKDQKRGLAADTLGLVMNITWLVFGGVTLFLSHVALAVGLAVTIIGIPFAVQHVKLALLSLFPFGAKVE